MHSASGLPKGGRRFALFWGLRFHNKKDPHYHGGNIRLCSCKTGADGATAAAALARQLGVDVLAPTDTLWIAPDGDMFIGPEPTTNTGEWVLFNGRGLREGIVVKSIGAFRENYNSDRYPSIHDAVRVDAPENKAAILAYLKKGRTMAHASGYFYDRVGRNAIIPAACYTDGVYVWRSDVIYYYENYNIVLPEDFIEHALKNSKRM